MFKPLPTAAFAPAVLAASLAAAQSDPDSDSRSRNAGVITIVSTRPSSLPTEIPTTTESATREQIERTVNAIDGEDALKYFPSLLVRKRYAGDYNHAILSSRASGTGNSARSAVYADGILLSNYLGNGVGGLAFPPRWEMVTPEEIERVDVMYGPFSAAYPGNSVGAVVDYATRMPQRFEAHAKLSWQHQPFDLYATHRSFDTWSASAAVGDRAGPFAWWLDVRRSDSEGQPLTFATRTVASGTAGGSGIAVTGAVPGLNSAGQPWLILGTGTEYRSRQDHAKLKLSWDLTPTLRAAAIAGWWRNQSDNTPRSYLRDATGAEVDAGPIAVDGRSYAALTGADFAVTTEALQHWMGGASLKTHTQGAWDVEAAVSRYDYDRDDKRQNAAGNTLSAALSGGPGTIADGSGSGWTTLALKATWRPYGLRGLHVVDFGVQQESYVLRYRTSDIAGDYRQDDAGALRSNVRGRTRLQSLWAQDVWRFAADWAAVLGLRAERWTAHDGRTDFSPTSAIDYPTRRVDDLSPKAALTWQLLPATVLKASVGRAVRMPTAAELYGAVSTTNSQVVNDPNLAPERSWTGELSAEQDLSDRANLRLTLFGERTRDAIYAQTLLDPTVNRNVSRVQNVDRIGTVGVEAAFQSHDWLVAGLDLNASVIYADSEIERNAGFVATPGDTLGRRQPNIPRWRATAVASWRFAADWSATLGARYSGRQYRTLNNADVNGDAYQGVSRYVVVDSRVVWRVAPRWTAALGVDNLTGERYWNFHPYPKRTYAADLKFDL